MPLIPKTRSKGTSLRKARGTPRTTRTPAKRTAAAKRTPKPTRRKRVSTPKPTRRSPARRKPVSRQITASTFRQEPLHAPTEALFRPPVTQHIPQQAPQLHPPTEALSRPTEPLSRPTEALSRPAAVQHIPYQATPSYEDLQRAAEMARYAEEQHNRTITGNEVMQSPQMDYVPDKPNLSYAMTQIGPTCFIAAALNILLCTKALRHYMIKVLNAEGAAYPGGPTALAAKLSGPFQIEPIRMLLLRLIFKVVCNDTVVQSVSNIVFTILFPDESKMKGGNSSYVLIVFCKALGITPEDVAIRDDAAAMKPVPPGFRYVSVLVDITGHAMSAFMNDEKPYVFDSDTGVAHQVDWRNTNTLDITLLSSMSLDSIRKYGVDAYAGMKLSRLRRVYLSETFLKVHNSPTQTRPGCYLNATNVPSNARTVLRPHRQIHPAQLLKARFDDDQRFDINAPNLFEVLDPIIDKQKTVEIEEEPFQCDESGQCTITPKYAFRGGRRLPPRKTSVTE